ncbi:MAG: hypothetical protein AB7F09_03855 [Parvibaculaceae bacterium]
MSPTKMISTRIKEDLLAEVDNYAAAKEVTRSDAIQALLFAGLTADANGVAVASERPPGWDAKEIARIAREYYQGLGLMFDAHNWPERGSQMLTVVQRRVAETYGSVDEFIKVYAAHTPEQFRNGLPSIQEIIDRAANAFAIILPHGQRDFMRKLVKQHGLDAPIVCSAFSEALKSGQVSWNSNTSNISADQYAVMVWMDGMKKGWLQD